MPRARCLRCGGVVQQYDDCLFVNGVHKSAKDACDKADSTSKWLAVQLRALPIPQTLSDYQKIYRLDARPTKSGPGFYADFIEVFSHSTGDSDGGVRIFIQKGTNYRMVVLSPRVDSPQTPQYYVEYGVRAEDSIVPALTTLGHQFFTVILPRLNSRLQLLDTPATRVEYDRLKAQRNALYEGAIDKLRADILLRTYGQ